MGKMRKLILHTDGGSRGNPGPAALGVVICNEKDEVLRQYGEYIGETTNNDAEYQAVISGLKKIKALFGKDNAKKTSVEIVADSELLVKQLTGKYKVEHPRVQQLFLQIWNLKVDFGEITFRAIPREQNKAADRMVNEALDANAKPKKLF